nr:tbc1 domain family member 20 [Quercus suber]
MENETKTQYILRACSDHDVQELRKLATSQGGLLEDGLRRKAWPLLLGSDQHPLKNDVDWTTLAKHRDEYQVQLDVERSFVHYPSGDSDERKTARKDELSQIITAVLRQHRMLHYFQGYHDIVQVLLLVLGAEAARSAVARLSLLRIRDFMLPTMSETESHLRLLPSILSVADRELCEHLSQTRPFFALAATLTLYAHEIEDYGQIARLFDFLLASEAVVPIYLFVAVCTHP